jgi:hypothetical protein
MNVTLSSLSEVRGEVRGYWECRVLSPALLWAFPALSRARCQIDYVHEELEISRPSFWPAGVKEAPLNVEMPTHSDHPGLRSLKDEADRCWDVAYGQMKDRGEWLRLMGAAPCMANTLLTPFQEIEFVLRCENTCTKFEHLLDELTHENQYPETRLLGYSLCKNTIYRPKITAPEWVLNRL